MADTFNTDNRQVAEGLDLFAAAWLEKWVDSGGDIHLRADGTIQTGYPMFDGSPLYTEADEANRMAGGFRYRNYEFCDAQYHGRMKTLIEVMDSVPGGRNAIISHMASHGIRQYYSTGKASA